MRVRVQAALAVAAVAAGGALWGSWGSPAAGTKPADLSGRVSSSAHAPPLQSEPSGPAWHLAFEAKFSGAELNRSVWATCYPWSALASGCTNFGNKEQQWYMPSQDRVSGGALHLVAQAIPTMGRTARGAPKEYLCRSGMVTTYPSFQFEYGILQIVARVPSTPGLWSGLWLAAADLRWPPEIDVLEHWGTPSNHTGLYFHPAGGPRIGVTPVTGNLSAGWHTFTLYWSRSRLTWFIDGRAALYTSAHIPRQKMYFIADLADYRLQPNGCDGELLIRSIRIWQTGKT
jgi:beta-glucanase (GH16 family)